MTDTIIKGTGNSRTLKTPTTLPATWEEARSQLIAGTFPIDIGALVAAGVQQQGTTLTKANLLSDSTAAVLGLTGNPTPNDALAKLKTLINAQDTSLSGKGNCEIYKGEYIGSGQTSFSLTFPKSIDMIAISAKYNPNPNSASTYAILATVLVEGAVIYRPTLSNNTGYMCQIKKIDNTVTFSEDTAQINRLQNTYYYVALAAK